MIDELIRLARDLGTEIQKDERYIKFQVASQKNEEDTELQKLIGEFNLKKLAVNKELNEEKNQEKVNLLNQEMQALYKQIMQTEGMQVYTESQSNLNLLLRQINAVIMGAAEGKDPQTMSLQEGCHGGCGGCHGCS